MQQPAISVIVPFYNVEPYFAQCLESIVVQTFADFEVLCIDDCGTDGSRAIAESFAQRDPRFKVVRHEANLGQGGARNTGIALAKGEYLSFVDSDDWLLPEKLEKEYAAIKATNAVCVWSKMAFFTDHVFTDTCGWNSPAGIQGHLTLDADTTGLYAPVMWNKLFRTDAVRDNGILSPNFLYHQDLEFYFKFFVLYPAVYVINDALYVYRQRTDSVTGNVVAGRGKCLDLVTIFKNCLTFLQERNLLHKRDVLFAVIRGHIYSYMKQPHYREVFLPALKALLEEAGYPESDGRTYDLDCILRYKKRGYLKYLRAPLSTLNRLNPVTGWRRKARVWLWVNS